MESYDMVTWKAADPASGTVVSYTNDGTANTGFVSEQNEPLGQSISLTPPPIEPQSPTYEAHIFDAYDPEWQCSVSRAFYGGFGGMPDHCQNKILKDLRIPLTETFGWHPSSLLKLVDSPLPGYVGGGSDGMAYAMGRALSSSSKLSLSGGTKNGNCVDSGSDGENIVICVNQKGLRDKSRADSTIPSDIGQRLDASNGDPLQEEDVPTWFMKTLRPFLEKALLRDSCSGFIKAHADGVDVLGGFDALLAKPHGFVQVARKSAEGYATFAFGTFANNNAQVYFNHNPNPWPAKLPIGPYIAYRLLVVTLIHEIIHLYGADDNAMARRLFAAGVTPKPAPDPKAYPITADGMRRYAFDSSNAWAPYLSKACLVPDEEFRVWWQTLDWGVKDDD